MRCDAAPRKRQAAWPGGQLLWFVISPYEAHIDEIVAMCDGDLRGALKALLLVNEHLESQLEQHATRARYENTERRMSSLH